MSMLDALREELRAILDKPVGVLFTSASVVALPAPRPDGPAVEFILEGQAGERFVQPCSLAYARWVRDQWIAAVDAAERVAAGSGPAAE
jgi:hypothetical protein